MTGVQKSRVDDSDVPTWLKPDQVDALLDTVHQASPDYLQLRDEALVLLAYDTGLRASEVVGLDVDHVHLDDSDPYVFVPAEVRRAAPPTLVTRRSSCGRRSEPRGSFPLPARSLEGHDCAVPVATIDRRVPERRREAVDRGRRRTVPDRGQRPGRPRACLTAHASALAVLPRVRRERAALERGLAAASASSTLDHRGVLRESN